MMMIMMVKMTPMTMTHISEGEGGYEAELWSLFLPAAPPIPAQSRSQIPPKIPCPTYAQISLSDITQITTARLGPWLPLFVLQLF